MQSLDGTPESGIVGDGRGRLPDLSVWLSMLVKGGVLRPDRRCAPTRIHRRGGAGLESFSVCEGGR